jgi:hypothetical protein
MTKLNRFNSLIAITFSTLPGQLLAFDQNGTALSEVVETLLVGGSILSKLMWAVCIVVGVALIAAAFTQFQIHRRNPKLVPLATPVLYLILGICAIAVPFVGQMKGFMASGNPGVQSAPAPTNTPYNPNDIDAPINR